MFRRLWTGLPETPFFPADLEKLGYFVNENDEIRSREDEKFYFKYFITRNSYHNDCQRFSFNTAVQKIILDRLAALGVRPVRLPLGAAPDEPHVCVLATADLATADRILLFVGETAQDLGVLAHRVIGGAGGIDRGSLVSMVREILSTDAPPAILICNPGELFWWPAAQRALSLPACEGMPRPSAAHLSPQKVLGQNVVPGHETADAHIASVFRDLLGPRCQADDAARPAGSVAAPTPQNPRITAIAIAGGADALEAFLDHPDRWRRWGPHMDSLVITGGLYEERHIKTDEFRSFLRRRARAYIASEAPVDTPIAGPDGNDQATRTTRFGCPVHSAGTQWLTEVMFIEAQAAILALGAAVARNPDYANPQIEITYAEKVSDVGDATWANYKDEDDKVVLGNTDKSNEKTGEGKNETEEKEAKEVDEIEKPGEGGKEDTSENLDSEKSGPTGHADDSIAKISADDLVADDSVADERGEKLAATSLKEKKEEDMEEKQEIESGPICQADDSIAMVSADDSVADELGERLAAISLEEKAEGDLEETPEKPHSKSSQTDQVDDSIVQVSADDSVADELGEKLAAIALEGN